MFFCVKVVDVDSVEVSIFIFLIKIFLLLLIITKKIILLKENCLLFVYEEIKKTVFKFEKKII